MKSNSRSLLASQLNPTKADLLLWVNNIIPDSVRKFKDISELGNGVAYLYILEQLRPGSVKMEKISK